MGEGQATTKSLALSAPPGGGGLGMALRMITHPACVMKPLYNPPGAGLGALWRSHRCTWRGHTPASQGRKSLQSCVASNRKPTLAVFLSSVLDGASVKETREAAKAAKPKACSAQFRLPPRPFTAWAPAAGHHRPLSPCWRRAGEGPWPGPPGR